MTHVQTNVSHTSLEVLSPAGTLEHLAAALSAGADACYVGLKGFSARPNPWSLSLDEIGTATRLAHEAGRRIYVAVNAEFHTRQYAELARAVEVMAGVGVDALIVGDFGLLYCLEQLGSPIPVHASTLLGIYNAEGIRFLQQAYGVTRVVLNTNLYVDEIADLHFLCPQVELEMIVHGGVCFNDNRRCRQPHYFFEGEFCVGCKQLYEKVPTGDSVIPLRPISPVASQVRPPATRQAGERLIWSPEVDLSALIGLLIKLGVVSFKIEGRTRATDYITMSTQKMRQAVDDALGNPDLLDPERNTYFYLVHPARLRGEG